MTLYSCIFLRAVTSFGSSSQWALIRERLIAAQIRFDYSTIDDMMATALPQNLNKPRLQKFLVRKTCCLKLS